MPHDYSAQLAHRRLMASTRHRLGFDGGPLAAWQGTLRTKLTELVGLPRLPAPDQRPPLNVRSLWKRPAVGGLGTVEKIVFTAEAGADVPAYLCLPATPPPAGGTYDWFVCVQGHSSGMHNSIGVDRADEQTPIEPEGDRDFALGCLRRGLAALCLEQRAFGTRTEDPAATPGPDANCQVPAMRALMLGRTLVGERVYDVARGLEILHARPDVNPRRIGILGNSSGGTTTLFAAALLAGRFAWAIPSCYFCTFADSIMSIRHCTCNFVPDLFNWAEMPDVMGLFAPNPVVVVAGETDPIFPVAAVRRAFEHLQRIYAAAGAPDACRLVIGDGGHRFYADAAWSALAPFLRRG